jgi:3',5'-cyclic-AMP phosphodiesterase
MTNRYTLLHLTDVHAVAEGLLLGSADSAAGLFWALDAAVASGSPIDAIILSGDIARLMRPRIGSSPRTSRPRPRRTSRSTTSR